MKKFQKYKKNQYKKQRMKMIYWNRENIIIEQ